jgi:predicted nucleic acid-binding protein
VPGRVRVVVDTNAVLDLWAFANARVQALRRAVEDGQLDRVDTPAMRQGLALQSRAQWLLTFDKDLLSLARRAAGSADPFA